MTNGDIINIWNIVVNRDIDTNWISPEEATTILNTVSLNQFSEQTGFTQQYNQIPLSQVGVGMSKKTEQNILPFKVYKTVQVVDGVLDLSKDNVAYFEAIRSHIAKSRGFDYIMVDELGDRINNAITKPTEKDPIIWNNIGHYYHILPTTIKDVDVWFYRYPNLCSVVYKVDQDTLTYEYDTENSVELEWEDDMKVEIAWKCLKLMGLNVERRDVVGVADNIINNGK